MLRLADLPSQQRPGNLWNQTHLPQQAQAIDQHLHIGKISLNQARIDHCARFDRTVGWRIAQIRPAMGSSKRPESRNPIALLYFIDDSAAQVWKRHSIGYDPGLERFNGPGRSRRYQLINQPEVALVQGFVDDAADGRWRGHADSFEPSGHN